MPLTAGTVTQMLIDSTWVTSGYTGDDGYTVAGGWCAPLNYTTTVGTTVTTQEELPLPGGTTGTTNTMTHAATYMWPDWIMRAAHLQRDERATREQLEARRARDREQRAREAEMYAVRRQQQEERRAARHAANERARQLLLMVLSPDERAHFERTEEIRIVGSDGATYRVRTSGHVSNVDLMDGRGRVQADMCAHPNEYDHNGQELPGYDHYAAQVLALRHDAEAFRDKANINWRY